MKFPKLELPKFKRPSLAQVPRKVVYLTVASAAALVLLNSYDERGTTDPDYIKDEFTIFVMRPLALKRRRWLSQNMPGFFPLRLSCTFTTDDKKWRSIVPGDELSTADPGNLQCSNGDEFRIEGGTTLRMWTQSGGHSRMEIESGIASTKLRNSTQAFVLAGAALDVKGENGSKAVAFAGSGGGFLRCEGGNAAINLSRQMNANLTLESSDCRIDVRRRGEDSEYTLTDGSRSMVADLALPSAMWPKIPSPKALELFEKNPSNLFRSDGALKLTRAPATENPSVELTSPAAQSDCKLYAIQPGHKAVEIQKEKEFSGTKKWDLPKIEKRSLFASCMRAGILHSSNLLPSIARSKAVIKPVHAPKVPVAEATSTPAMAPETATAAPVAPEAAAPINQAVKQ